MSSPQSRLSKLAAHFLPSSSPAANAASQHRNNYHTLSPTFFLPRAAAIEPDVGIAVKRGEDLTDSCLRPKQYIMSLQMEKFWGDRIKKQRTELEGWHTT